MRIEVLGIPFNGIRSPSGIENPAQGLRDTGLLSLLEARGHAVADLGDMTDFRFEDVLDPEAGVKDFRTWFALSEALAGTLPGMLDRAAFPLLLGGDCSMLVGIMAAFAPEDSGVGLIFIDGHADFHYPHTSPTGEPADMELAVLTGRGPEKITRIAGKFPLVKDENVVVFGLRSWDQIVDSKIRVIDRPRMTERGVQAAVAEGMEDLRRRRLPLWLHFDVDVLDPGLMPVVFPEPDGLTFAETQELMSRVIESNAVIGMSVACYHPVLDSQGVAGSHLASVIVEALSTSASFPSPRRSRES
jgi:arginase